MTNILQTATTTDYNIEGWYTCLHAMIEMLWWILSLLNTWERWFFNQWDRQDRRKNLSRSWTYDLWLLVQMFQIISLTVIFLCYTFFQKHKVFAFVRNGLSNNNVTRNMLSYDNYQIEFSQFNFFAISIHSVIHLLL